MDRVQSHHGRLHSDASIRLFKEMGAPPDVIELLYGGVQLYFKSNTPFHSLSASNNLSAIQNAEFVDLSLRRWLSSGAAQVIPRSEAKVVSPLSVNLKWDHAKKKIKPRLCFDGSRLKKFMIYRSVQLPDITHLATFIDPYDEISVVDLENFYFHFTVSFVIYFCLLSFFILFFLS